MLHKTRGIVLSSLNYNDKYKIIHIYTEAFGQVPYLVAKSKGKKSRVPLSLFHPFAVLAIDVEHLQLRDIQRIKEARRELILADIPFNPVKVSVLFFLSEFMYKVVKDIQANQLLFDFVYQSIVVFDLLERDFANFHLVFMMRLSLFLGFLPNGDGYRKGMYFDMQSGTFAITKPTHPYFLSPDDSEVFLLLLRMDYENMHAYSLSRHDRVQVIYKILDYYKLHFSSLTELKSLDVLQSLFSSGHED